MFTGIVQSIGNITTVESQGDDVRVHIAVGKLDAKLDLEHAQVGDSIAVNGVCLTATSFADSGFWADVSGETSARTTFGKVAVGSKVNLEQSLTPTTRLGGHLVSGHVDGIGTVISCWEQGRSLRFVIQAPPLLAKYIAEKGSICVDGVSLTVNKVNGACFDVNIVPHTLQETTLGERVAGDYVNLEVDILARYLERLLLGERAAHECASAVPGRTLEAAAAQPTSPAQSARKGYAVDCKGLKPEQPGSAGITHGFLVEHGFIKI